MTQEKLIEYLEHLIAKGIRLKEVQRRSSLVLQGLAILFSVCLFGLMWKQAVSGVGVGIAAVSDLAGTTIIIVTWLSARATWRISSAYSSRIGQLEDLKLIILMSDNEQNLDYSSAGKLVMSLRRDGLAKEMDLDHFVPKGKTTIGKQK